MSVQLDKHMEGMIAASISKSLHGAERHTFRTAVVSRLEKMASEGVRPITKNHVKAAINAELAFGK